ncbi:MAG: lytic transglycosylase domain-containing protein [Rhodospirillales bacterium]|jgi:hypothetical protein|nr:lytic transglycosylase domain-containing protein [Rhodospirillales bacterium]
MRRIYLTALSILVIGFLALPSSVAKADKAREFALSWDLCEAATHAVEREVNLPDKLLQAISIAESGRRDDLNKSVVAWPWTVTSGPKEWYLDSKDEAIALVNSMINSGIRNIDVGCMQINLHYHGKNFRDIEQVLDPLSNVSYAATFLKNLRKRTSDWITAAGNYHSTTPEHHNRYRERIAKIWENELNRKGNTANTYAVQSYYESGYRVAHLDLPPIDTLRTKKLNDALRNRLSQSLTENVGGAGGIGSVGGDSWKSTYMQAVSTGESYLLQAQINRIRKAADEQNRINNLIANEAPLTAKKRTNDLDEWRNLYGITLEPEQP